MEILKKITDFIYRTGQVSKRYLEEHPAEKIYAVDASKGIITKGEKDIEKGFDWVTSQRAVVILTDKRIKCGQWDIPLENILNAQLIKINTTLGPGQVLKITTKDQNNFQFGMQMNKEWINQKVLPLTLEKGKIKYSLYSILVRIILVGLIIYWIIERIK